MREAKALVMMEAFLEGDGSIDFPSERVTSRRMKRWQTTFLTRVNTGSSQSVSVCLQFVDPFLIHPLFTTGH